MLIYVVCDYGYEGIERVLGVFDSEEAANAEAESHMASVEVFELNQPWQEPARPPATGRPSLTTPSWVVKEALSKAEQVSKLVRLISRSHP